MKTAEMLDAAQKKLGVNSDYALAKAMGITKGRIGHYRTGIRTPDEQACFQIADILGIDPAAVIATVKAERETEPSKAAFWRKQTARYAAALAVLAMLNSGSVAAAMGCGYTTAVKFTSLCIMRNQG